MEYSLSPVFSGSADFKVNISNGEAFISQRKAEELIGLSDGTLRKHLSRHHPNYNTSNGLDAKILQSVTTYFAIESRAKTQEAVKLLAILAEAGAKAFIYHHAGVQINAEAQPAFRLPGNYLEALKDLVSEVESHNETKLRLEHKSERLSVAVDHIKTALEVMTETVPKAKAFDEVLDKGDNLLISEAAKVLGAKQHDLFDWLAAKGWIFRRGSKPWQAYADKIQNQLLAHRYTKGVDSDGLQHNKCQVMVTPAGVVVLKALLGA